MKYVLVILSLMFILTGYGDIIPEQGSRVSALEITALPLMSSAFENQAVKEEFFVRHLVQGNDVYVECVLQDYSFSRQSVKELVKIGLFVDGKSRGEIETAAFIIKDLQPGMHKVKLELKEENKKAVTFKKEFAVHIHPAT